MHTLVLLYFVLSAIRILAFAILLGRTVYPRTPKYSAGSDVISLLTAIAFALWAAKLLWL